MTRLHELRLNNNRIRLDQQSSVVLQPLGQLRLLDVSDNPLGPVDLPLDELRRLRELHARNCRLQRLPADLLWAGYLELADLRDNQIATLQPIVFQTPYSFRRALLLAGNPLPASAHARLMQPGSAMLEPVNEGPLAPRRRSPWNRPGRSGWVVRMGCCVSGASSNGTCWPPSPK
jgi:hypothetical protein